MTMGDDDDASLALLQLAEAVGGAAKSPPLSGSSRLVEHNKGAGSQ